MAELKDLVTKEFHDAFSFRPMAELKVGEVFPGIANLCFRPMAELKEHRQLCWTRRTCFRPMAELKVPGLRSRW